MFDDALGRRIETQTEPRAGGTGQPVPQSIVERSWFDPEEEFLEVAIETFRGTGPATVRERWWKVHGPDLGGNYGGLAGLGGLEALIEEASGRAVGLVDDCYGHILGFAKALNGTGGTFAANPLGAPFPAQASQIVFECNVSRFTGYGPLPGNWAPSLAEGVAPWRTFGWRGKRIDVTGFYHLGARYYEPNSGRFLSPDPLGHGASMGLYDYAGGDPINFVDPRGRNAIRPGAGFVTSAGGTVMPSSSGSLLGPAYDRRIAQISTLSQQAHILHQFGLEAYTAESISAKHVFPSSGSLHDRIQRHNPIGTWNSHARAYGVSDAAFEDQPYLVAIRANNGVIRHQRALAGDRASRMAVNFELYMGLLDLTSTLTSVIPVEATTVLTARTLAPASQVMLDSAARVGGSAATRVGSSELGNALSDLGRNPLGRNLNTLDEFGSGAGFSGVYDVASAKFLAYPSGGTRLANGGTPLNLVQQFGGHADVNRALSGLLGNNSSNRLGFSMTLDDAGNFIVGWNSRTINLPNPNFPGHTVPEALRPQVLDAIMQSTGRVAR